MQNNINFKKNIGGLWTKNKFKISHNESPLISLITTTYNSEKYLEETLKSIFNQKYQNFEIIIIDGGSKDKTIKIINKYEKKIDYWISEKDKGIYDAFNKGLKLARGHLIGMVNSDDILKPNALKILVQYYNKYPNKDFFFGSVKKHWGIISGYKKWKVKFSWGFYSSHSTGFYIKKNSAKKVGKYDTNFKYHADWDYFYRMIVKHQLQGIGTRKDELFGIFRRGGYSSKIDFSKSIIETIKIRKKNGQNKFFVLFLSLYRLLNNLRLIKKKSKSIFLIFKECLN